MIVKINGKYINCYNVYHDKLFAEKKAESLSFKTQIIKTDNRRYAIFPTEMRAPDKVESFLKQQTMTQKNFLKALEATSKVREAASELFEVAKDMRGEINTETVDASIIAKAVAQITEANAMVLFIIKEHQIHITQEKQIV